MTSRLSVVLGAVALSAVLACAPLAADDLDHIKYRQQMMQAVGGHTAAISTIVRGKLPLMEHVAEHADQLADLAEMIPASFKSEVADGPTDAKPEIWSSMADFNKLAETMRVASEALAEAADTAADTGDRKAVALAMRDLGKSCGACHQPYRKPKEESYKAPK